MVFLLSLLAPSLSLLFCCSPLNDKNARKEEQEGKEALFFSQWMGQVSGVGSLPVDPPHASANSSSRPIASLFFSLFPNGKSERVPEDERWRLFFNYRGKRERQG